MIINDTNTCNTLYRALIIHQQKRRDAFYAKFQKGPIWDNELIKEHVSSTHQKISKPFTDEKKLLMIIKDFLIFPELYINLDPKILSEFYQCLDDNPHFSVFFTSSGRHLLKPHAFVAIGCDVLKTGVSVSGTGDPTRIKMTLPATFQEKLIRTLESNAYVLSRAAIKQFGNINKVIQTLKSTTYFDSKAINILLEETRAKQKNDNSIQELIQELNQIIFTYRIYGQKQLYATHQEVWTKPRSFQQFMDTQKFNSIYPTHLEDLKKTDLLRFVDNFHHPITRRVAVRKQPDAKVSSVLKNYLSFEQDKKRRDDKRTIAYRFNIKNIWRFGSTFNFMSEKVSSCVGFATRLLGRVPIVASFANIFSRTGLLIQTDEEKARESVAIKNFIQDSKEHLHFAHAKQKGNIRNQKLNRLGSYGEGCGVIYDPTITKYFSIGLGPMVKHVWGCKVTDGNGILLPKSKWKPGWVNLEKLSPSSMDRDVITKMLGLEKEKEVREDPRAKDAEHVTYKYPYDAQKYRIPKRPAVGSIEYQAQAFQENQSFLLGSHLAEVKGGKIHWNGHIFDARDYKGHPLLIPSSKMYDWLLQRRISKIQVDQFPDIIKKTVVFGTATDKYPLYPDLLGFMPRRNISNTSPHWIQKKEKYDKRHGLLNPDREKLLGQQGLFRPPGYHSSFLQNRNNEIVEKCGLQIKHAPRKIIINRFIRTYDDFIFAYLSGSQGIPKGTSLESEDIHRARPVHISDHELYRAFGGKHRDEILEHMHFADEDLVFDAPSKVNRICYHPIRLLYHRQFGLKSDDGYVSPLNLD